MNHDQTCTKQSHTTATQKQTTSITQESDPSSRFNTVEIVNPNEILQAAIESVFATILIYFRAPKDYKRFQRCL